MKKLFISFSFVAVSLFFSTDSNAAEVIETLKENIELSTFNSDLEILKSLPVETYSQSVFLYSSFSMQEANYPYPRVVAFGNHANLIVGFNGHKSQIGYQALDILEYNTQTLAYDSAIVTWTEDKFQPKIEVNSQSCLQCHSSWRGGVLPVTDTYLGGVFVGVYGSLGGTFSPLETLNYAKFLEDSMQNKRYQMVQKERPSDDWPVQNKPLMLGTLLNQKVFQGITQYLIEQTIPKKWGQILIAGILCTENSSEFNFNKNLNHFIPEKELENFNIPDWKEFQDKAKNFIDISFSKSIQKRNLVSREYLEDSYFTPFIPSVDMRLANFWYLIENLTDNKELIKTTQDLIKNRNDANGGIINLLELVYPLYIKSDSDMFAYFTRATGEKEVLYSEYKIDTYAENICPNLSLIK